MCAHSKRYQNRLVSSANSSAHTSLSLINRYKIKFYLCLINYILNQAYLWGSESMAQPFLASFQMYSKSASRFGRFYAEKIASCSQLAGGMNQSRSGRVEKGNVLALLGIEPGPSILHQVDITAEQFRHQIEHHIFLTV